MKAVTDFIFLGSKITEDSDCICEIKVYLHLERKAMTNLDKSWDITFLVKVHLIKAMVFPVVMCWCESWTIKKAECWRIDAFKLWCWRTLLRVPWTTRRSNLSILKEINAKYWLKRLAAALILWLPGAKSLLIGKDPDAGNDWRQKEKGAAEDKMARQHHQLNRHESEKTPEDTEDKGACSLGQT